MDASITSCLFYWCNVVSTYPIHLFPKIKELLNYQKLS